MFSDWGKQFYAVATYATGPFLGVDTGLAKQYGKCLAAFCATARSSSDPKSRLAALHAIEGAVASEIMYSAAADFKPQINNVMPAIMQNCMRTTVAELSQK